MRAIVILFIVFGSLSLQAQNDSCLVYNVNEIKVFELIPELAVKYRINTSTILGQMAGILTREKDKITFTSSNKYLDFAFEKIQSYLDENPDFEKDNYIIQLVFFKTEKKNYVSVIFMEVPFEGYLLENSCFSGLILSVMGGGDSFFYKVYDLDTKELVKEHVNGW
ncbi:hypothetical protein H9Y05_07890 [Crocinitomicaceae bacterium CZZ-1]|uniref:DUF4252 domain-containing protein n=1 Tax=Taishania pollutisoli TaxID=2766479 RepID=A0A8J6PPH5_9FLAO|nr:hypothetical protein [Taishania pollutisoli]MBC9812393.1 hypothetical protein [Taishania pollutisoli]